MRDAIITIASLVVLVVGLFALMAIPAFVEDLWERAIAHLTRRAPRVVEPERTPPPPDRDEDTMPDTPSADSRARRLEEAEAALSIAEGDAYRASAPQFALKTRARALREAAERTRADAAEATERADRHAATLLEEQGSLEIQLPAHVDYLRRYNAQTRAGRKPRYTEAGVRLIDHFDDYGLMRCLMRIGNAEAAIEAERARADALIGVALRLEAAAVATELEMERIDEANGPLRDVLRDATARWNALKAEVGGSDSA